jgi:hypothetical protein
MATGTRDSLEKAGITPFYLVRQQVRVLVHTLSALNPGQ